VRDRKGFWLVQVLLGLFPKVFIWRIHAKLEKLKKAGI